MTTKQTPEINDLTQFLDWVREKPTLRCARLEIDPATIPGGHPCVTVWVYDRELGEGQHCNSVADINLEQAKEVRERALYQRLHAKYGGQDHAAE